MSAAELGVVLVGAGEGRRMGGLGPKLFLPLLDRPLLVWSASTLLSHPAVGELVAVVPGARVEEARALLAPLVPAAGPRVTAVSGGDSRQASVRLGLAALEGSPAFVAVHDAARPLLTHALIDRVLSAARLTGAAIPGLPLRDTVKEVEGGRVLRTLERDRYYAAQTPQVFMHSMIARAHERFADTEATDDASLVESLGESVAVVLGEPTNLKITEAADLKVAASLAPRGGR